MKLGKRVLRILIYVMWVVKICGEFEELGFIGKKIKNPNYRIEKEGHNNIELMG